MFSWIYWNPNREIFTIPYINWPILWYSVLFIIGFILGYKLFQRLTERYLLNFPKFTKKDILSEELILKIKDHPVSVFQKEVCPYLKKNKQSILQALNALFLQEDLFQRLFHKIKKGSWKKKIEKIYLSPLYEDGMEATKRLFLEKTFENAVLSIRKKALLISDKVLVYMVIATLIGARLGHLAFYESPSVYLTQPWIILQVWQGGLASHGAVVAIIIALFFLSRSLNRHFSPQIGLIKLLDLVAIPTALAAVFIRIGNFFNQEIVGLPSNLPWAVLFGRPADHLPFVPRHPTQVYEAVMYFAIFILLYFFSRKKSLFLQRGRLIGLFFILVFGGRFFIEYLKPEQSNLLQDHFLLMGQYLSLPIIAIGIALFFYEKIIKSFKAKKK